MPTTAIARWESNPLYDPQQRYSSGCALTIWSRRYISNRNHEKYIRRESDFVTYDKINQDSVVKTSEQQQQQKEIKVPPGINFFFFYFEWQ